MVSRVRLWWQQIKQHRLTILVVAIVLVVVIALIIVGYRFDWTGFNENNKSGKTRMGLDATSNYTCSACYRWIFV